MFSFGCQENIWKCLQNDVPNGTFYSTQTQMPRVVDNEVLLH